MNTVLNLQYAMMCLQALFGEDRPARTARQISQEQGIPYETVVTFLKRFREAGLVAESGTGNWRLMRSTADLQVMEVLEAVFRPADQRPAFRLWWPPRVTRGVVRLLKKAAGIPQPSESRGRS